MSMTRPTTEQITHNGRLLSDVLFGVVSVKEFGAVGDGVADDTAAIASAIEWHRSLPAARKAATKISLEGGTYVVDVVIITPDNNGLTFGGGKLVRRVRPGTGGGFNGVVQMVQGSTVATPLDGITIEDIEIVGSAQYTENDPFGLADEAANQLNWQWMNGIEALALNPDPALARSKNIVVRNAKISGCGKSGILLYNPSDCRIDNVQLFRIAQHALGATLPKTNALGNVYSINVSNVVVDTCSTIFDWSIQKPEDPNFDPRYAIVNMSNVVARKIRGRTKIHGPWSLNISNLYANNEEIIPQNRLNSVIDIATPYCGDINISNFNVANHYGAFEVTTSQLREATLTIRGLTVWRCAVGIENGLKNTYVYGFNSVDTYMPFRHISASIVHLDGFRFVNPNLDYYNSLGLTSDWQYPIQFFGNKVVIQNGTVDGIGSATSYTAGQPQPSGLLIFTGGSTKTLDISNVSIQNPNAQVSGGVMQFDQASGIVNLNNVYIAPGCSSARAFRTTQASTSMSVVNCNVSGLLIDDASLYGGTLMRHGARTVAWASAAPTAGTWVRGDIIWNSAPSAGGSPGWVCVTAGTPGTWKAMANVAA